MIRLKLSPELVDGDNWTVVDEPEEITWMIREWWKNVRDMDPGESFTVETVKMSDAEVEALAEL